MLALDDDVIVSSLHSWSCGESVVDYTGAHHQGALLLDQFEFENNFLLSRQPLFPVQNKYWKLPKLINKLKIFFFYI